MELLQSRSTFTKTLRAAFEDRTASAAMTAHRELGLHAPSVEEIASYRKCGPVMAQAMARSAESLLYLRTKQLKGAPLKKSRRAFQREVEAALCGSAGPERKEFAKLALSFSRLFALYYVDEHGRQPDRIEGRLESALPILARHLRAELEMCKEARFANPARNLCKVSVFDMQAKLDALENHPDEVVRNNAKTITTVALSYGDLDYADTLAKDAKTKLVMLENHPDAVVRVNANLIICAALRRCDLTLADRLAEGAKAKMAMLESHTEAVVKDNTPTIMCAALRRGDLGLADTLAEGAAEALIEMKTQIGNAHRMRISQMLNAGTLDVERFLKKEGITPQ